MLSALLALALLAGASPAGAGKNADARYKLNWGTDFNDTQRDASTPDGINTTVTLWVSAIGLTELRGAEIQIIVASDQAFWTGAALPSAWQFQNNEPTPCPENEGNLLSEAKFPGSGLNAVPGLAVSQAEMLHANSVEASAFNGVWFIWISTAGTSKAPLNPATRYGLGRFTFTLPGASCPGAGSPICFWPNVRVGFNAAVYPNYRPETIAVLDGNLQYDFLPADPGFAQVTANYTGTGTYGCPAPTGARATSWGKLRGLYR